MHRLGIAAPTVENRSGQEWNRCQAPVTPGWAICPPGRRGPASHHSEGCNLDCTAATVDQHASEPGNTPAADCEQRPPRQWAANRKHSQHGREQRTRGIGPARARTRGSRAVDSDKLVEQTAVSLSTLALATAKARGREGGRAAGGRDSDNSVTARRAETDHRTRQASQG